MKCAHSHLALFTVLTRIAVHAHTAHEMNAGTPAYYCNATLGFGLPANEGKAFVDRLWSANVPNRDYWNGVLYMLSLLHVRGNFKLYY